MSDAFGHESFYSLLIHCKDVIVKLQDFLLTLKGQ